jgi:uroporphyrinogen-III synthase
VKPPTSILVIREDDIFSRSLRAAGVDVTNLSLIRTEPVDNQSALRESIEKIDDYDGLFFTSPSAAEIFTSEFKNAGPYRGKVYAMGSRSKEVLERSGSSVEFDPSISTAEELVGFYGDELYGKRFLFVRGDRSMQTVPNLLKNRSQMDEVVVYRTVSLRPSETEINTIRTQLDGGKFEWICFFSPSAIDAFFDLFGDGAATKVAVIGQTTAARASEKGLKVAFVSPQSHAVAFANALVSHLNGTHS